MAYSPQPSGSARLLLTCLLALFAVHFAHIDGRTDELSNWLATVNPYISLQGIVLAGMIVGALGVLADIAVTQASVVMVLRRTDPNADPTRALQSCLPCRRQTHPPTTKRWSQSLLTSTRLPLLEAGTKARSGRLD